jgi:formylglycine-generating enzyme required for sulfatase activity
MIVPFSLQALSRFVPQSLLGAAILAATTNLASAQLCGCNGNIQTYCTAGTSVQGCLPSISGVGVPNVLAPSGFDLVVGNVPGQRYGTIFYGFYSFITPWAPGSPSFKCVASPVQRMGNISTGGTIGQCNGELRLDFNAWIAANPAALGGPFAQGQTIRAQGWYRDPAAPGQTNLSNAVTFTLCGANAASCPTPPGFVPITPGNFSMGSNASSGPPYYNSALEQPVHPVTITYPFYIAQTEVTQAQFFALMGWNPSFSQGSNRPVEQVAWNDAVAYCDAFSIQQASLGNIVSGYEYRLPTEAEWEFACRAGTTTEYSVGAALDCSDAQFSYSFHVGASCSGFDTLPVGSFPPNGWGLYDMHGNVMEWCLDSLEGYSSSPVMDPFITGGPYRVIKGGSFNSASSSCRSAWRTGFDPQTVGRTLGFRVVLGPILVP